MTDHPDYVDLELRVPEEDWRLQEIIARRRTQRSLDWWYELRYSVVDLQRAYAQGKEDTRRRSRFSRLLHRLGLR